MQTTGSKPSGLKGMMAGLAMNLIHSHQYRKIIKSILNDITAQSPYILDIGCGGGRAVNLFCKARKGAKIFGIDISPDMVRLSEKVNKKEIAAGRAEIACGDVGDMPYEDGLFDLAAAFDTINFWSDIDKALSEVRRVLKDDGVLLIVNGYPKEGTKWWDFVKFKNDGEYRRMLEENRFQDIEIEIHKHTIIIRAKKVR
jgi:SAM-dependent methyltransferase